MKNLLQTHSISWAESVRLVLESEGVEAVVLDPNAGGFIAVKSDDITLINWITLAACGLLLVTAFALIALGPRADKKKAGPSRKGRLAEVLQDARSGRAGPLGHG
jgi:hypothetical protein